MRLHIDNCKSELCVTFQNYLPRLHTIFFLQKMLTCIVKYDTKSLTQNQCYELRIRITERQLASNAKISLIAQMR